MIMMWIITNDSMIEESVTIMMVVIDICVPMTTRMIIIFIAKIIHSEGRGSCIHTKTLKIVFIIVLLLIYRLYTNNHMVQK